MTRKYIPLFIVILLICTTLGVSILGEKGFLVQKELKQTIAVKQKIEEEKLLHLANLTEELEKVWEKEHLLDEARNLGYVQKGESVFYFDDELETGTAPESDTPTLLREPLFKGLSFFTIFLYSTLISVVIIILIIVIRRGINYGSHHK